MAARLQLRHVGVAVGVVDELVMGVVLQAVVIERAEQREHRQPVAGQVVESAVAEEDVVAGLVGERRQPVLARPDTLTYRTVKLLKRHKAGAVALLLVVSSLVGGMLAEPPAQPTIVGPMPWPMAFATM